MEITSNIPQINLDDYEIKEFICQGAYANVVKAINKKTQKAVAIKSYIDDDLNEESFQMIVRGVNVSCSNLSGLVKTIGYRFPLSKKEASNSKYDKIIPGYNRPINFSSFLVIMDYYKYAQLYKITSDYLESKGSRHDILNPTVRSKIIFGVASIMKQLHREKVLFRDLKVENVYLTDDLEPIIGDFEQSNFIANPQDKIYGTPYIIAPEVFMDEEPYSFPIDVYSYAFVLYRLFESKIEFPDGKKIRSSQQFMHRIFKGIRLARPKNIPDHYWELIQRCWKQNPDERPTFEEIVEILKDDKYALEEFGMKTDLEELHRYQNKIEGINTESSSKSDSNLAEENKKLKESLQKYKSILSYPNQQRKDDNYFVDDEDEKLHDVIEKVGEGATSVTYKIFDTKNDQLLCKKVLKGTQDASSDFKNVQNALKEFQVLYKLNHPCVCKVIGINTNEIVNDSNIKKKGQEITTVAIFLEFLEFKLSEVLKRDDITNTLKIRIVLEIAHAMKFIHKNGLIHRDLKIENIMLNSVFEAKVIDFGLVRIHEYLNEDYSFVQDSMTRGVGTLFYMSPEMLNEEKYDYKTDVYSFGVVLYYMFVGSLPKQNLKDKMNGKQISMPSPSDSISKFCINLIKKCLATKPDGRPTFENIINEIRSNDYSLASHIDKSVLYRRDHELELFESE